MGYDIEITGILYDGCSAQVKSQLDASPDEVNVLVNSFGGSLNEGLMIAEYFRQHGGVNVVLCGFCASAATILTLGAKRVSMDSAGFYLIHQVSNYINVWGQKNADQLREIIKELSQTASDNDKIDMVIAQMYSKRTGMSSEAVIDMMRKSAWLTADEAKEHGFVDEVVESRRSAQSSVMLNAAGLPPLPQKRSLLDKLLNVKPNKLDMSGFTAVRKLLSVDTLELKDNKIQLSLEQFETLNNELSRLGGELGEKETELSRLTEELDRMKQSAVPEEQQLRKQRPSSSESVSAMELYNSIKNLI